LKSKRRSGVLLHPSSLPSPDGIGDMGPEAYRWVDFLVESGFDLWQMLPLGPTGYGDSPYQSFSAFGGNPILINSTFLLDQGLLKIEDLDQRPAFPVDFVDYGPVINWKNHLLDIAYQRFLDEQPGEIKENFERFKKEEADWLSKFALFMAIKEINHGTSWDNWEPGLRKSDSASVKEFSLQHGQLIDSHKFKQFLFFYQWISLKNYANNLGIKIIGDIPIFISFDSSDAWSNPELFYFDQELKPTVVAGVPPDYFSSTGQLWGNPLYRWEVHRKDGYSWWIKRIKATLKLYDYVRLDHFRGFVNYWEVPAGSETAETGKWVAGPGAHFFEVIEKELGKLPIIAEDLGEISQDVFDLRDQFNFPGMKILQFAFASAPNDLFLPHNYPVNCIAYTGTHDNDTALGWFKTAPQSEQDFCLRYLNRSEENIAWEMVRSIWSSAASIVIAPFQDFLQLGSEARMNYPGRASGNWSWRLIPLQYNSELAEKIYEMNFLYGRVALEKENLDINQ
jgi:4-alpha-glucanotransferase